MLLSHIAVSTLTHRNSGSGEIDYDEFMDFLDDKRSPFTDAVFALVDKDGNGVLDFDEFLQALSMYCMTWALRSLLHGRRPKSITARARS